MEHNPSLTPAYLAGKVDEYVKFAARDTIRRNARRDPKCRYARIPDGKACDFCRMLGSRGFVYHGEFEAGGDGNDYHPHCNCQLAVSFDPFIEKYEVVSESGTVVTVTRGYGMEDAELVRPGRDGSYELREVDIDELFDEYKAMGRKFTAKSKYKDYTLGSKLSDEEFAEAMERLQNAKTLDELHEVGQKIVEEWEPNAVGRNQSQWNELSRRAKELEQQLAESDAGHLRNVQRNMANGGRRSAAYRLDDADIALVKRAAEDLGIPADMLSFNTGKGTSFSDVTGKINVRGDVFPDDLSTSNRDTLTVKATLAHEYYGHQRFAGTVLEPGDWRDEFRASYRAALDAPNLSQEERASLMVDAYERASEAGVTLQYTKDYRRIVYGY